MKREMENIKENQVELLETKSIISETNNSWDEINIILDITGKNCEFKEMEIETSQIESEKKTAESEMERTSVTCAVMQSGLSYM